MSLKQFPLNSTDGTVITPANSKFSAVAIGSGGSATYTTDSAVQGSTGAKLTATGASVTCKALFDSASASTAAVNMVYEMPSAAPASDLAFLTVQDTANVRILQVIHGSGGNANRFFTNDKANTYTSLTTATQATNLTPAGTPIRVEIVISAISATAGAFTVRLYNNSTGAQIGSTVNTTVANLGTTAIGSVTITTGALTYTVRFDSLQLNDGSTSEIGPFVATSTPPTVSVGSDLVQTTLNQAAAFSATAQVFNGSVIDHYNWSVLSYPPELSSAPTITNPTQSAPQVTPTVSGRYQLQVTATDSAGLTSSPAVQTLYVPGSIVEVIDTVSNIGPWVISALGNLTDGNDATDLASPTSATTEATFTGTLAPLISNMSSFTYTVRYKLDAAASGVTFKVRLIDGSTVRKEWTPTAPTTAAQNYDCTLSAAEIATLADTTKLKLQFAWTTTS